MTYKRRHIAAWMVTGLLLFLTLTLANAQSVRRMDTSFSTYRIAIREAEKQGRTDWPKVADGEKGTQAHITYSLHDADMTLVTDSSVAPNDLLKEGRRIALELGWPRTDFLHRKGTRSRTLDLEFNKYIKDGKQLSSWSLDLGHLARILESSSVLPQPIILLVHADEPDSVILTSNSQTCLLKKKAFFGLNEIPTGTIIYFEERLEWYAPLLAFALVGLLVFTFGMLIITPWRIQKIKARVAQLKKNAAIPDPETVQKRYNKQWPIAVFTLLFPLSIIVISFLGNPAKLMKQTVYALPFQIHSLRWMLFIPPIFLGGITVSYLLANLINKRRKRLSPHVGDDADKAEEVSLFQFQPLLPMLIVMCIMPVLIFLPGFSMLPRSWRIVVIVALAGGGFITTLYLNLKSARKQRTVLRPGDYWHDAAMQMALEGGVRITEVVRLKLETVNAMVSLTGNLMLTDGLLNKMEPDEIRAIIAHEIGHLKRHHVRKNFALSLTVFATIIAVEIALFPRLRLYVPEHTFIMLNGPVLGLLVVPLNSILTGGLKRRHEEEADRYAVESMGNRELVIRALTKVHTLNAMPHSFKLVDEILLSHPSLTRRIEAMRRIS